MPQGQLLRSDCNSLGPESSGLKLKIQLRTYISSFRICAKGARDSPAFNEIFYGTVLFTIGIVWL